ncbi:MAG TPA: aconitate hydratase AcnA [Alphaproteobacteria bacterium]|nr:aconitate hydratase AcnA [Alphaproteobacteria bacterium]
MSSFEKESLTSTLKIGPQEFSYFDLKKAEKEGFEKLQNLPYSLKILFENLLRNFDGETITLESLKSVEAQQEAEISFYPTRVLMQDFTGVPAVVDLAAMRDAMVNLKGDPKKINPLVPVDLVIDHSVMVDYHASPKAFDENVKLEFERNNERYEFLKWGKIAFKNFKVVPPGTGICHQVNLEYLAKVVWTKDENERLLAYPDSLVGTDSHTTMVNGLSVLGWGVGGIEAEAVMLGQPLSMVIPGVVGFELKGALSNGTTATDLVLTITNILRTKGVVGKFVEFYGSGLKSLSLADRATIANMAPEYGATCGFFPVDEETLAYLRLSGREETQVKLVEAYAKAQGLWSTGDEKIDYRDTLSLELSTVRPSLAGPKRPQDKVLLEDVKESFKAFKKDDFQTAPVIGKDFNITDGHVVIAAITSCTNNSNPSVMIGAGILAKKAAALGLKSKPWVKTSLAPGSQVVTSYLENANLLKDLEALGFNVVGYGCTTCIGNSGSLDKDVIAAIESKDLNVGAVLSGNRNFEGRVNPHVKANYLASPALVVAYALAGTLTIDLSKDSLGKDNNGKEVYLKDIWPSQEEIGACLKESLSPELFQEKYAHVFEGTSQWQKIPSALGDTYSWKDDSSYIQNPPYFRMEKPEVDAIKEAKILAILGDSITTDHISPAGSIKKDGPAGKFLSSLGIDQKDFNSYGARRGNHEVMMRGTFANIRLQNEMTPDVQGGWTKFNDEVLSIYDAALAYEKSSTPLVVFAGKEYGTGSSRDWAAKGTRLLGVRAVIAESFERIHRSNLVGMGVLPLVFENGVTRKDLNLTGKESIDILGLEKGLSPKMSLDLRITYPDSTTKSFKLLCRVDTKEEVKYFQEGGILNFVLKTLHS